MKSSLPDPDQATLERVAGLTPLIDAAIAHAGGVLPFDAFMELALYTPGLGYYAAAPAIFGAPGDFLTAPEAGTLFAACLARQLADLLPACGATLVEYGAGSGALAAALLASDLPIDHYHVIEPSAALRARQHERLAAVPGALVRTRWHAAPPHDGLAAVVVANEVLDALPVKRFVIEDGVARELGVARDGAGYAWRCVPGPALLPPALAALAATLPEGYTSEWCPRLGGWLAGLDGLLERGVALVVDYGYPRHDYYHPARVAGTLTCHFRHRVHDDALWLPGAQDLTASVDFTSLAEAALARGFAVAGYATQARFLLACGLPELLEARGGDTATRYREAQEAKLLLLPGEMGETCKVLALARGHAEPLRGFLVDDRARLAGYAP